MSERESDFLDIELQQQSSLGEILLFSNEAVLRYNVTELSEKHTFPEIRITQTPQGVVHSRVIQLLSKHPMEIISSEEIIHEGWMGKNLMDNPLLEPEGLYSELCFVGKKISENSDYFLAINGKNTLKGYCTLVPKPLAQSHHFIAAILPREKQELALKASSNFEVNIENLFAFFITAEKNHARVQRLLTPQESLILDTIVKCGFILDCGRLEYLLNKEGYSPEKKSYEPAISKLRKTLRLNGLEIKHKDETVFLEERV